VERLQSPTNAADYVAAMTRVVGLARHGSLAGDTQLARQPANAEPVATAAGGRYANYSSGQQPGANVAPPGAQLPQAPAIATAPGAAGQVAPPAGPGTLQTASQPAAGMAATASQAWPPQLPPGNAPLGLDGQCPVTLVERQLWTRGDTRFGMQHQGRTYLFAGPEELRRFQENPNLYSPVMSGDDPVLALDQRVSVPGSRMYGLFCAGHVYLFANEQTLQQFKQNPRRYTAVALEARR